VLVKELKKGDIFWDNEAWVGSTRWQAQEDARRVITEGPVARDGWVCRAASASSQKEIEFFQDGIITHYGPFISQFQECKARSPDEAKLFPLELPKPKWDNQDRNRAYGLRVGDVVVTADWMIRNTGGEHRYFEVTGYSVDNNRVFVKDLKTEELGDFVAEWLRIVLPVEKRNFPAKVYPFEKLISVVDGTRLSCSGCGWDIPATVGLGPNFCQQCGGTFEGVPL